MNEQELRDLIIFNEFDLNEYKVVQVVIGEHELSGMYKKSTWENGYHKDHPQMLFTTYIDNFKNALANQLIERILYPEGRPEDENERN